MFGIREPLPTPCDACASLAKVLSASPFKPSLAGHAGCQAQPAWLHSQLGQWMTEGYQGWLETDRERRAKNVPNGEREEEASDRAKERGRQKDCKYSSRILIKWNSSCKVEWSIFRVELGYWECGQCCDVLFEYGFSAWLWLALASCSISFKSRLTWPGKWQHQSLV